MVPRSAAVVLTIVFAGGVFLSATHGPLNGMTTVSETSTVTNTTTQSVGLTTTGSYISTSTTTQVATSTQPGSTVVSSQTSTTTQTTTSTQPGTTVITSFTVTSLATSTMVSSQTTTVVSSQTSTVVISITTTRSTTVTVTATPPTQVAVSPNYGCLGTTTFATVVGDGFSPGSAITVLFSGTAVGSAVAGSQGSFMAMVSIANSAMGTYSVTAVDSFGTSGSTSYYVLGPSPC